MPQHSHLRKATLLCSLTLMAVAQTLSALIDEHLAVLSSGGYAASTRRTSARVWRAFLAHTGNIQLRHVTSRHVDSYFAARMSTCTPATLNLELATLRRLFKFASSRGYMRNTIDPTGHRRRFRVQPRAKRRVPVHEFGRLLDAATHPRDRAVVALGIYLLLRQSEIKELRVGDVDLEHGAINARILKTAKLDEMPVSAELDVELRRWLTWYTQHVGPLQPTMHLAPAKARPTFTSTGAVDTASNLDPWRPVARPEHIVQRALAACGYEPVDDDGRPTRDGVHTLRRSAARAMFDRLVDEGYDGAGRVVQSLLHHSSFRMTEVYLGIDQDDRRRNDVVRGKEMFPTPQVNVVQMRRESWQ